MEESLFERYRNREEHTAILEPWRKLLNRYQCNHNTCSVKSNIF
jgi:hypothetical protein